MSTHPHSTNQGYPAGPPAGPPGPPGPQDATGGPAPFSQPPPRPVAEEDRRLDGVPPWGQSTVGGGNDSRRSRSEGTRKRVPSSGWRRLVYLMTGGLVCPNLSEREQQWVDWLAAIDAPVKHHRISVSSRKGGIGKTTQAILLGTAFSMFRRDAAMVIDANPDRGTAADRVGAEHDRNVRNLIDDINAIRTAADLRAFTSVSKDRLEVLASDPVNPEAFTPEEFRVAQKVAETFKSIVITDCGTDMKHDVMSAIFENTDTLIVPSSTARVDSELAWETLDMWSRWSSRGADLVRSAVVPITQQSTDMAQVPIDVLVKHFSERVGKVVVVPRDRHLAGGDVVDWGRLDDETRRAEVDMAAHIASQFNLGRS